MPNDILIRPLHTPAEMNQVVELQYSYWGDTPHDIVPQHMLLSMAHYGGHVFGAFDAQRMVGMLVGFLGADIQPEDNRPASQCLLLMSKRMIVLPEYRGHKIGERLKNAQRDLARRHGIQRVTWTFDPMLAPNAYLNLHKLRGVVQKYVPDFFGEDAQNPALRADRVALNWWVNHPRLDQAHLPDHVGAPLINPCTMRADGFLIPAEDAFQIPTKPSAPAYRLQIPADFTTYQQTDPELAQTWRDAIRHAFTKLLQANYIATDFTRDDHQTAYIFTPDDDTHTYHER